MPDLSKRAVQIFKHHLCGDRTHRGRATVPSGRHTLGQLEGDKDACLRAGPASSSRSTSVCLRSSARRDRRLTMSSRLLFPY